MAGDMTRGVYTRRMLSAYALGHRKERGDVQMGRPGGGGGQVTGCGTSMVVITPYALTWSVGDHGGVGRCWPALPWESPAWYVALRPFFASSSTSVHETD